MADYPEAALDAATEVLERWCVIPYAREAARRVLDKVVPLLAAPERPEHGAAEWSKAHINGSRAAACFCGASFVNLNQEGADEALQYHITVKLHGHRPGVTLHYVRSWGCLRPDTRDWAAQCSCSVTRTGGSVEAANAALRAHFEEENASG